jgi:hypothetical protein
VSLGALRKRLSIPGQFLRIVWVSLGDGQDALDRVILNPHLGRLKGATNESHEVDRGNRAKWQSARRTIRRLVAVGEHARHEVLAAAQECVRDALVFAIVATIADPFSAGWNPSHVFNDEWPSHARFHGLVGLGTAIGLPASACSRRPP